MEQVRIDGRAARDVPPSSTARHSIVLRSLSKSFAGVPVLRDVNLTIGPGEFVALMGPNGAGKSTLIKILAGVHSPTGGSIEFGGAQVQDLGNDSRVGFLHQDLGLVPALNVMENMRLGEKPLRRGKLFLDRGRERIAARNALGRVKFDHPVDTLVSDLAPGEQALVAVARLLGRGAQVLVVDEATSSLTQAEALRLTDALSGAADEGTTVIMVSHRMSEILESAQRVVVLQDGRVTSDTSTEGLSREGLVDLVGSPAVAHRNQGSTAAGEELIRLEAAGAGRAGPVDLVIRAGEAIGLTGLAGSGLHDIAYLTHGRLAPARGRITRSADATTAIVPPHREREGGFDDLDVKTNLSLSSVEDWRRPGGILGKKAEREWAAGMIERLAIVPPDCDAIYGNLSGGNKQKVIFGRALAKRPSVYVLCEPTRGVDIATRHAIYALIGELREGGAGVLVTSSDVEDLIAVCQRVAVVADGVVGDFREVDGLGASELEAAI